MTPANHATRQVFVSYTILALALSAVVFAALATPIRERLAFLSKFDAQQTTYARSLDALARSESVGSRFELRHAASDPTRLVFHAQTAALAGAELQNQLNALVAAEGGTVLSSAFRDLRADGPLTPIAVTLRLRSSMDALVHILHGVEDRAPLLFVENLTIQPRQRGGRSRRQEDGDLDVELDVVGLMKAQAAP